ncbi:YnjH family protein [Vibrio hangzhouensis]|uniref:YnjH family protein n=1 Tax=Vibrio hangzhouensis TaxID=462991 RepID=UPI001C98C8F0|nr:YnjH family protein [Vibrio hangzhouensis]MBY6196158.1 YnjH family protein [Vibrio hangzhouensis]
MERILKQWKTAGVVMVTLSSLFSSPSVAKTITTPGADVGAAVLLSDSKLGKRVCYYNDKAYSLGSVINVEGIVLQCVAEQDFEMNGQLKWKQLKSEQ